MRLIDKAKEDLTKIANEQGYWGFIDYLDSEEVSGIVTYTTSDCFIEDKQYVNVDCTLTTHGFIGSFMFGSGLDNDLKEVN